MQLELSWPELGLDARQIAGVDEAGRGPWAGPVVAAAVILDPARLPEGIGDSKAVRPALRIALAAELLACAQVGVGAASVAEIDRLNILGATMLAMRRAVSRLPAAPRLALVDGNRAPDLSCEVRTLVKGDARHLAIGAASIVAKVTRDRLMARLGRIHPGYGWEHNAGYGTAAHRRGLERLGVTAHHRKSFAPIRNALNPQTY